MAKDRASPVFNIEDTDPYLDAEQGAWLHLEDRRDVPATKLYADPRTEEAELYKLALDEERRKPGTHKPEELAELKAAAEPQLPVRIKLVGFLADAVQAEAAEIEKETAAIRQARFDAAKVEGKSDEEARKLAVLTADEVSQFDSRLYACCTVDSQNLGYKGHAQLSRELAQELYRKRADIRMQVREYLGKPANFKRKPGRT